MAWEGARRPPRPWSKGLLLLLLLLARPPVDALKTFQDGQGDARLSEGLLGAKRAKEKTRECRPALYA